MIKTYKIGSLTTGLFFISLGVALLINLFYDFSLIDLFYWGWPVLLILLGLETILLSYKRSKMSTSVPIRYDLLGLFTFILFALVSLGLYVAEESGVKAMAQQTLATRYYTVPSPVYTVDNLSQIDQIIVIGQQGEIKLETTEKEAVTAYSTWKNIAASSWEEAQSIADQSIDMVREGSTLYLFVQQPPQTHWGLLPSGSTTLIIPAHLSVEVDLHSAQLTVTIDQLYQDWKVENDHGPIYIYTRQESDVTITAQGLGDNLRNPEAWDEVEEDHSWGRLMGQNGSHQLQVFTQSGMIDLYLRTPNNIKQTPNPINTNLE